MFGHNQIVFERTAQDSASFIDTALLSIIVRSGVQIKIALSYVLTI
jgi:hypothetical protein